MAPLTGEETPGWPVVALGFVFLAVAEAVWRQDRLGRWVEALTGSHGSHRLGGFMTMLWLARGVGTFAVLSGLTRLGVGAPLPGGGGLLLVGAFAALPFARWFFGWPEWACPAWYAEIEAREDAESRRLEGRPPKGHRRTAKSRPRVPPRWLRWPR